MTTPNTLHTSDGSDSSRFGAQALERAGEKVRDIGFGMKDMAHRGMSTMSERAHLAQRELGRYATATGRYVTEQPLKSALIAAGIGALVAGLIIALRHRDH